MSNKKILASILVALAFQLNGCRKGAPEEEAKAQSQPQHAPDEIVLSTQAQREQNVTIARVETGKATLPQRAKGRIALPDNASWRVGVLAEGRIEDVYANLGDSVRKGQLLARMHNHDVHEARAAYANAVADHSRFQAAEALAQRNKLAVSGASKSQLTHRGISIVRHSRASRRYLPPTLLV